jgi:hypothetical protein
LAHRFSSSPDKFFLTKTGGLAWTGEYIGTEADFSIAIGPWRLRGCAAGRCGFSNDFRSYGGFFLNLFDGTIASQQL